ncbi:RNA polymerase sigma factor [Paenibacillus tepidiphilus]|uniref:RNA polymerase sigma factor n=1 Tax=Paenibacillus tepidiphilus TaxID=2608683 RepID=UPI001EF0F5E7|nr:RNA polymerase sigma factor [Paenibacillus tepidiphilus]
MNPNMIEEAIDKVSAGERQAYTTVIQAYEKQIYTYCFYILRSREEAEDAVQDIFVKVYRELGRYERRASFSAWLYKIAYHHCLDQLRQNKRRSRLLSLYQMHLRDGNDGQRDGALVDTLFAGLTSEESALLILHVVEQYSFEEMAEITGRSPAALRKRYERLRKKLIQQKENKGGYLHGEVAEFK